MSEAAAPTTPATPPRITCPNCGREIPAGEFCGACGAQLQADGGSSAQRRSAFAANPTEHVFHLSLVSTLLPHLPHRRTGPFRFALIAVGILLAVLGLLRLTGPALAAAALAVPVLYLVYLYEVEVYEDEPVTVVGLTFVVGLVLGIPWALLTGPVVTQDLILNVAQGPALDRILVAAIAFPVVAQAIMLIGALLMFLLRRRFDEALDGFTFGVASALGFAVSTTLVELLPSLQEGLFSSGPALTNALTILERGILIPVLVASTTGLVAGSLWLGRGRRRPEVAHALSTSVGSTVIVALAANVVLGLVNTLVADSTIAVGTYAVVDLLLLLWVRVALHHMLLAEAVEVEIGPDSACTHCHRIVPRMAFCPHCGVATRSTPKHGEGRSGRVAR